MGRYFIHLAYHGGSYNGWQRQPGLPTVQQALEDALSMLLRQEVSVVGCGRTDTGVHASDFYAHFDCLGEVDTEAVAFKLNSVLPAGIAVFGIVAVHSNAHARFDAIARTYQYHVSRSRLPFRQGQYCRLYYTPDIAAMNEAAKLLTTYEDFTSFAKLHTQVKTNICHLSQAEWTEEDDGWVFTIRSNRFLRNMVRSVVGTLLEVGRGRLTLEGLKAIVERRDRSAAGVSMPACGLFLTRVEYPDDEWTIAGNNKDSER
ncbi:MAG: tRNA pseudouridine(38-40) synthase TruA [Bacteroidales bacterium]|nr:tRNA pseudouridine(38-40) synthase TruA [Bacteroidales bacterium]